ncbi:putative transcription factor C2H2 family [Lupinus albus]|uniref:Putative transcription factor C2H2 family n=1 Tax=Lupinus albus TaxID=3870 RepID=A0A6A4PXC9_LUPAL|nr:putative transcription factor C2H2 family [Lupinus albus]
MGFHLLVTILTKSLTFLTWPPLSFICPLYASVRAMKSDSRCSNQQCLAFWVLFSFSMIIEREFAVLFNRLPWWPNVKSMATILLLIPYFGGSLYIYKYLIKCYCTWNICTENFNIVNQKSAHVVFDEDSNFVHVTEQTIIPSQIQEKKLAVNQGRCEVPIKYTRPTVTKQVQKEWSCALCQISTTSENCLLAHLQGKKHKTKESEVRNVLHLMDSKYLPSSKGIILLRNLNQIVKILNPVSRSIRLCEWIKPNFGWIKLNTDGSIHDEIAGFGGLLRDHMGEPICAYVSKAPQGDVFLVELWAIWRGLVLSLSLGITALWVESDSMSVVKTINKEQPSCSKAYGCLEQIWKLLTKFDKYHISHSWRETNRAADHLAKMVLWGNDVILWPIDFPHSLRNIIDDDARGKKYIRR